MSETELKEKKDRIDDALHATRAAIEEGIVPGGGIALIRAAASLESVEVSNDDEGLGVDIVRGALSSPLGWLCANAGVSPEETIKEVKSGFGEMGYDVANGVFTNMFNSGIVDPAKVTRLALQNAASVAGILLTTETAIVRNEEKQSNATRQ
jgi:chaperonin GroEL